MPDTNGSKSRIELLHGLGQSAWLDYIDRHLLNTGGLAELVRSGVIRGVTSNPTIFEKAISGSNDYERSLREAADRGLADPYAIFLELAIPDIQAAADVLRPVYDASDGADGFVSLEVPPSLAHQAEATVAEARRLFALVGRPNAMIKVPGTAAGAAATRALIADGVNINVTLLFSVDQYMNAARAYIGGLEDRLSAGQDVARIASVASFFVSRVDTAVDAALPADSPLRGRIAVANARYAYRRFAEIFSGAQWQRLEDAGARVQRPLWASTGTKNPAYSDILYVQELIGPHTVNTMPEATLTAAIDHLDVQETLVPGIPGAERELEALPAAGIDLTSVTSRLLDDGLKAFANDFDRLLVRLETAAARVRTGSPAAASSLGPLSAAVASRLDAMAHAQVISRIWARDHTVWKLDPTEIDNRLGWLGVSETMQTRAGDLESLAREAVRDGLTTAVLLGMGGSSLAPEVFAETFGPGSSPFRLEVLDSTDPTQIRDLEQSVELSKTLFIVASKSGDTVETRSHFAYFWDKIPDGKHFVVVTDPGSALEALGRERGVRRVFLNPPDIGGRYSALSYFGLVAAALVGVDLTRLLSRAREMAHSCGPIGDVAENPGAWLGAVLAEAARAGRDKLTLLLPPELTSLGHWIEQLIAESTGKEGTGIVPVEGEAIGETAVYGDDRIFVTLGDHPEVERLEAAGHPIVRLAYSAGDRYQLGAEYFRWEFATAVAGHVLGINPFDQPNVQESKDATRRVLAGEADGSAGSDGLEATLAAIRPGDYVALMAYLPRNAATKRQLGELRTAIRDHLRVATTVGFGPRFLHSTGQLHKGGANNGVFLQVVSDDPYDLEVPGQGFSFRGLEAAQALGDLLALKAHGRRVWRGTLSELTARLGAMTGEADKLVR